MTAKQRTQRKTGGGNHRHLHELRGHVDALRHEMREMASTAGEMAMDKFGPVEEYIQAKPVQSLLIAAGIGAVVGFLIRRR